MKLSVTTDYARDTGDPSPYLARIADAGFSHVHWCHHWNTDFLYSQCEIDQIRDWLMECGLRVLDLHASAGIEKDWASPVEYQRLAGLELVRNRIEMSAQLGGDVIIMHIPDQPAPEHGPLRRSLDALLACATERGVRIALENGNFKAIGGILSAYDAGYLGLCYDAGHGNMDGDGLDQLATMKERLISVHLHDNDGSRDLHNPLFSGTVDWPRLARIIAASAYGKPVSMETTMADSGMTDEGAFLKHVFETGARFAAMIDTVRCSS